MSSATDVLMMITKSSKTSNANVCSEQIKLQEAIIGFSYRSYNVSENLCRITTCRNLEDNVDIKKAWGSTRKILKVLPKRV